MKKIKGELIKSYFIRNMILGCVLLLSGGNEIYGQDYIQRSPEVAKMMSVNNIPVSMNTGMPQINIPIYTVIAGDISLPISLSYQANGVRLKDRSGLCGVKWSLNAGGMISASQYNKNVEHVTDVSTYVQAGPDMLEVPNYSILYDKIDNILKGSKSYEPLTYSYSFLNYSGSIYYYGNRKDPKSYLLIPHNNLKIETDNIINDFKIIDSKGVEYFFKTKERTNSFFRNLYIDSNGSNDNYDSAFFLDYMISSKNNKISFTYKGNKCSYPEELYNEVYVHNNNVGPNRQSFIRSEIDSKRVETILSSNGDYVSFEYLSEIANNDKSAQLKKISIFGVGGVLKKSYVFTYVYNGRYFLKEIQIKDSKEKEMAKYEFEYIEGTLPPSNSKAFDYFGYYNGKTTNSSIVPDLGVFGMTCGDRTFNKDVACYGLLKSIKYPTGLKRDFVFETHTAKMKMDIVPRTTKVSKSYIIDEKAYHKSTVLGSFKLDQSTIAEMYFAETTFIDDEINNFGTNQPIEHAVSFYFQKKGERNTGGSLSKMPVNKNIEIEIPAGEYEVVAFLSNKDRQFVFGLTLHMKEDKIEAKSMSIPPFRIKKIISSSEENREIENYTYSEGKLINKPVFNQKEEVNIEHRRSVLATSISSKPNRAISPEFGSYVHYNTVSISNSNGKTEYHYDFLPDEGSLGTKKSPLISNKESRSKLRSMIKFNNRGDEVERLDYKYSRECVGKCFGLKAEKSNNLQIPLNNHWLKSNNKPQLVSIEFYEQKSFKYSLDKLIKREIFGEESIETITDYKYDDKYSLLNEKSITLGKDIINTRYFYPFDYSESIYKEMIERNQIDYIVLKEDFKNGKKIGGNKTDYAYNHKLIKQIIPIESFLWDLNGKYNSTIKYKEYNKFGMPQNYSTKKEEDVILIWSYKNKYPVAVIKNIDFSDIEDFFGGNVNVESFGEITETNLISDKLDLLRKFVESRQGNIVTYLFSSFGMISKKDENSNIINYEYDDFGRLKSICDKDDILKSYRYNYKH